MFSHFHFNFKDIFFQMLVNILICILCLHINAQQKFMNYGVDSEGVVLFHFFHDVYNGFYVDIGSYDPIFASNTLNLQTMGWEGINVDASPNRLPRFFYSRPWEPSINYAIGDEDVYLTLYELSEDSSSTVSPKVKQFVKGYKGVVQEVKIPSISMKKLCERFFFRRPIFLNLDIEGYGSMALQSNDWNNPNCKPEIIFSQINDETVISGLPLPQKVLKQHGYKKWSGNVGLNQIFILQQLYEKYTKKYEEGVKTGRAQHVLGLGFVAYNFVMPILKLPTVIIPHYEPANDSVVYHFAKYKQPVDIYEINKFSNLISAKKDRPIIVLNYNPQDSFILLMNRNYSCEGFKVLEVSFVNITIYKEDGAVLSVYIMNHQQNNKTLKPKILITNIPQYQLTLKSSIPASNVTEQELKSPQNSTESKLLSQIQNLLSSSQSQIKNTSQNIEFRYRQLLTTMTTNHYYDKSKFQQILQQTSVFKSQISGVSSSSGSSDDLETIASYTKVVLRNQIFILFTVFFCLLVINVLICVINAPMIKKNRPSKMRVNKQVESQSQMESQTANQNQKTDNVDHDI